MADIEIGSNLVSVITLIITAVIVPFVVHTWKKCAPTEPSQNTENPTK